MYQISRLELESIAYVRQVFNGVHRPVIDGYTQEMNFDDDTHPLPSANRLAPQVN